MSALLTMMAVAILTFNFCLKIYRSIAKYDSLIIVLEPFIEEMDTGRIEYYKVGINDLYISEEENRIIVELIGVDLTHVHRFLSQIANMPEFQIKEADLPVLH